MCATNNTGNGMHLTVVPPPTSCMEGLFKDLSIGVDSFVFGSETLGPKDKKLGLDEVLFLFGEVYRTCLEWNRLVDQCRVTEDKSVLVDVMVALVIKQTDLFETSRAASRIQVLRDLSLKEEEMAPNFTIPALRKPVPFSLTGEKKNKIIESIFPSGRANEKIAEKTSRIRELYKRAYSTFKEYSDQAELVREFLVRRHEEACDAFWTEHQLEMEGAGLEFQDYKAGSLYSFSLLKKNSIVSVNWGVQFVVPDQGPATFETCYQVPPGFMFHRVFRKNSKKTKKKEEIMKKYESLCLAVLDAREKVDTICKEGLMQEEAILECFHNSQELKKLSIFDPKTHLPFDHVPENETSKWKCYVSRSRGDYQNKTFGTIRCVLLLSYTKLMGAPMKKLDSGIYENETASEKTADALEDFDLTTTPTVHQEVGVIGMLFEEKELVEVLEALRKLGQLSRKEMSMLFSLKTATALAKQANRLFQHDPFYDIFVLPHQ